MRNVLATDIKNNIRSIRFILGIFLIVSATLMSEHEMLQKIINAGGSAEGPGWFVAYTYCMNSVNMLLFVPIAVAFAQSSGLSNIPTIRPFVTITLGLVL